MSSGPQRALVADDGSFSLPLCPIPEGYWAIVKIGAALGPKFYGFVGGDTHQYAPALVDGTSPVEPPDDPDYHLIPAWADMPDDLKPVLARQMEVYAGFLDTPIQGEAKSVDPKERGQGSLQLGDGARKRLGHEHVCRFCVAGCAGSRRRSLTRRAWRAPAL